MLTEEGANGNAAKWRRLREDGSVCYGALVRSDDVIVKNTRRTKRSTA